MRILQAGMWTLVLLAVFAAAVGIAGSTQASPENATFLGFLEYQASAKFHCTFTNEGSSGIGGVPVPPLPVGITAQRLVTFFRKNLPKYVVWRDRVNKSIIHIVDRRVLAWKSNPLNKKITIKGTMSISYLQSHIFAKEFPRVRFYDMPFHRVNTIPYLRKLRAFKAPIKFDVRDMTLRRFLTTGIPSSAGANDMEYGLWSASYQFHDGRPTGHVTIIIFASLVLPPPTAARPNVVR